MNRRIGILVAGLLFMAGLAGCAEIAPPDKVGIWYAQGQSDGNKFDHCVPPSKVDNWLANNSVYWLENNLRTWNASPQPGGDTDVPLTLTAKPDSAQGQQTGLQVNVWTQTNFMLNTYCGPDDKSVGSPVVQWWQRIGDRYDADTVEGWRNMLLNTVVPALEKAKNVLREYTADELVAGAVWADAEKKFGDTFMSELRRLSGGDWFCGPDYAARQPDGSPWPNAPTCSTVQVSIKDVDLTDPGVQAARNEKQKALETAAARVAEAEGKVRAARAEQELYSNQAWVQLEALKIELQRAQACAASAKCTMILDASGKVQILTSP